jgi:hypothetical protein
MDKKLQSRFIARLRDKDLMEIDVVAESFDGKQPIQTQLPIVFKRFWVST